MCQKRENKNKFALFTFFPLNLYNFVFFFSKKRGSQRVLCSRTKFFVEITNKLAQSLTLKMSGKLQLNKYGLLPPTVNFSSYMCDFHWKNSNNFPWKIFLLSSLSLFLSLSFPLNAKCMFLNVINLINYFAYTYVRCMRAQDIYMHLNKLSMANISVQFGISALNWVEW